MSWIEDHFEESPEEFFARELNTVYMPNAPYDDRFTWQEITPQNLDTMPPSIQEKLRNVTVISEPDEAPPRWADLPRYRMTGCSHRMIEDGECFFCGAQDIQDA